MSVLFCGKIHGLYAVCRDLILLKKRGDNSVETSLSLIPSLVRARRRQIVMYTEHHD